MSYISALYKRNENEILVWEKVDGKRKIVSYPASDYLYFYIEDDRGEFTSIYGKKLRKHDFLDWEEFSEAKNQLSRIQLYESDISPDIKVLSQHYYGVEPPKLNITLLDIEVDYNPVIGFASPANPYAPINAIALHHIYDDGTEKSIVIAVPPKDWNPKDLDKSLEQLSEIVLVQSERELLNLMLEQFERTDVLSGWNCIPIHQNVWLPNKIVPFNQAKEQLYNSRIIAKSSVIEKPLTTLITSTEYTVQCSPEHKFPVLTVPKNKYTNLQNSIVKKQELSALEIDDLLKQDIAVFVEFELRTNNNPPNEKYTNEQLYLAGLIYTDGTLKDKNNITGKGYVIYQSDKNFLENLPLVETSIIGPHKNCYSREVKYSLIGEAHDLIYDTINKKLNIEELSTLSYTQFTYFLAGLLDGDGYISSSKTIEWCNFNNDIEKLSELCLWNGIVTSIRKNVLRFPSLDITSLPLRKHSRWSKLSNNKLKKHKNTKQKASTIKYKVIDNRLFARIQNVIFHNVNVPMMDIETDTHYFYTKGIKTHNSQFFDIPYICKRLERVLGKTQLKKMSFEFADAPRFREVEVFGNVQIVCDLSGRIHLDYLDLFKKYEVAERPSYKLESIAEEVLPDLPKLKYEGSLADLYKRDFNYFLRYNIRDTEILKGFEHKLGYIALANTMCHTSTAQFKDVFGTLKLTDYAIVNYCHYELNVKVPDWTEKNDESAQGAYVLYPQKGLHEWIGLIDVNSLYPNSIISINISPEKLIGQFQEREDATLKIFKQTDDILVFVPERHDEPIYKTAKEWRQWLTEHKYSISGYGTVFDQSSGRGVLPAILTDWYAKRKHYQKLKQQAKEKQEQLSSLPLTNDIKQQLSKYKDEEIYYDKLQYVYKIKLNSAYGAFLNLYFRFFDERFGNSTTATGRLILQHQARKVSELLDGNYDFDLPLSEETFNQNPDLYRQSSVIYCDTDSVYFKTHATNEKQAVKIADYIGEKVNESFPEFMRTMFLCNPGFDDRIKSGRELVADRGIFVDKKRYVLHVVDVEGHKTDKMKVMGLELKKTTLPKPIAKKLSMFIERLLKGETWEQISKDVVKFKDELMETDDIMLLGLPKGIKGIEEYERKYKLDPQTRLPGHVAAGIFWNEQINQHNDKESLLITSNMKIKVFYLTKTTGRFKSIAVPTDTERLPEWFMQHFAKFIDREAQIQRLIDDPLQHIFDAINKEVPSKQSMFIDEILEF